MPETHCCPEQQQVELPPDWVEFEDDDGTLSRGRLWTYRVIALQLLGYRKRFTGDLGLSDYPDLFILKNDQGILKNHFCRFQFRQRNLAVQRPASEMEPLNFHRERFTNLVALGSDMIWHNHISFEWTGHFFLCERASNLFGINFEPSSWVGRQKWPIGHRKLVAQAVLLAKDIINRGYRPRSYNNVQ